MITPAKPQDAAAITELAMRSKAHWGYDDAFMEKAKAELTYSAADITDHPTFKVVSEEITVGFYQLIRVDDSSIELDALFISPESIGTGLGQQLFNHAIEQAKQLGYQLLTLQSDPNAMGFYQHMGCIKTGQKPSLSIPGRKLTTMTFKLT